MKLSDPQLEQAYEALLPRERRILEMKAAGKTLEEIGATFGRSRSWAQLAHASAKSKVKSRLKRQARAQKR